MEIQRVSKIGKLQSVDKLRKVFVAIMVISVVAFIPIGIWQALYKSDISDGFYDGFIVLALLILLILTFHFGDKLMNIIKKVSESTKNADYQLYLKKVTITGYVNSNVVPPKVTAIIFLINTFMILVIFTLIIFPLVINLEEQTTYIVCHWILRAEEFGIVLCMLIILGKKKPSGSSSSSNTTEVSTRKEVPNYITTTTQRTEEQDIDLPMTRFTQVEL